MELHVGCAMWTYPPWQGRYLPPRCHRGTGCGVRDLVQRRGGQHDLLRDAVADTVRSWAGQTAPDFRFLLKMPRLVTHERHMADVGDPVRGFLAAVEPLGGRADALWIQLPPSFGPGDLGTLAAFLRHLPGDYRYAVEVRHRAFFADPRAEPSSKECLATSAPNGCPSTRPSCSGSHPPARLNARPGPRSHVYPAGPGL